MVAIEHIYLLRSAVLLVQVACVRREHQLVVSCMPEEHGRAAVSRGFEDVDPVDVEACALYHCLPQKVDGWLYHGGEGHQRYFPDVLVGKLEQHLPHGCVTAIDNHA